MIKGDETRGRIRDAGFKLLRSRGYHNTSMNDIVEYTGVKKGNLYFHYGSKEDLAIEVLKDAAEKYNLYINSRVKPSSTAQKLHDIIDAIYDYNTQPGQFNGCLFGNMALETGGSNTALEFFVRELFSKWERMLETHIVKGISLGDFKPHEKPVVLARMILAAIEGGIMLTKISGSIEQFTQCRDFIKSVISERAVSREVINDN